MSEELETHLIERVDFISIHRMNLTAGWKVSGINKKLRSTGKSRSGLDMHTVFTVYKDEARKLSRADFAKCAFLPDL
jgi:hypothetical protein